MSVIDTDDFNRVDNASSMGTTAGGRTWTAHATGGNPAPTLGIISNTAYFPGAAVGGKALIDCGVANHAAEVTIATHAGFPKGLSVRHETGGDRAYTVSTAGAAPTINTVITETGGGGVVQTIAIGWADGDTMRVEALGNTLKVYKNGAQIGSDQAMDAAFAGFTRVGLYCDQGTTPRFDDFSVESLDIGGWTVGAIAF